MALQRQIAADYPPPEAFGLPYDKWRPGQWEIASGVMDSPNRFHMVVAPTGFGKSLAYMGMAKLSQGRVVVLTATKALQDQLNRDFGECGIHDARGKGAYPCELGRIHPQYAHMVRPSTTAATAPCKWGMECDGRSNALCPYFHNVKIARQHPLVVTNYDFWLYNDIGEVDLLIMDEAHQGPNELADFLSFHLTSDQRRYLSGKLPEGDDVQEWRGWAKWMHEILKEKLQNRRDHQLADVVAGLEKITRLLARGEWVVERFPDGAVHFDCVNPEAFGQMLWSGAKKVVMVSATCNPMTAQAIGISGDGLQMWEAPSAFPVERRPVWAVENAVQVNFRMVEGQKRQWVNLIDRILQIRPDRKGIVHTTSFERARYLQQHSAHSSRLLLNDSRNTKDVVSHFKAASSPLVLVSPSMTTGWDFPYSQCEFQVIGKVPFPDLRTKAAKVRAERNREWAGYMAAQQMVQSSGRGMRAEDDQCETFIVDGAFGWWWKANKKWTPKWWQEAVKWVGIGELPDPPAKMRKSG